MTDIQNELLDAIYNFQKVDDIALRRSLSKRGFEGSMRSTSADIQLAVVEENKNAKQIEIEHRNGIALYTWIGPHFGARRSIANLYPTLRA